jgi:hypothetical protein
MMRTAVRISAAAALAVAVGFAGATDASASESNFRLPPIPPIPMICASGAGLPLLTLPSEVCVGDIHFP